MSILLPLYPYMFKNNISDITAGDLESLGIKGLLLDVDNTLTTQHSQHLRQSIQAWLRDIQAAGFKLTVLSNGLPKRVRPFAEKIGLRSISFACKPFPFGFWRGARRLGLPLRQCAVVGDQTFTDILGSRIAGVKSIQVMPMEYEKQWTLRLKRRIEKIVYSKFIKREARRKQKEERLRK